MTGKPAAGTTASPDSRVDAVIFALARRQHGVVTRGQLVDAGVPAHRVDYRLRCGTLLALHRGVYRVGPIRAPLEEEMAAILACGPSAVLSHCSAAILWDVLPARPRGAPVDVSTSRGTRRAPAGARHHRLRSLGPTEITCVDGIPVTTLARTFLDLASCLGMRELERALAHADREGLMEREELERIMERHRAFGGIRRLRALLEDPEGPALTRSEAEARFLALVRRARLSIPEANVVVRGFEVDFLWRPERLVVEIDGFAFHRSKDAFERDHRRDAVLTAAGLRVFRITWTQLVDEPEALLAQVAQALARSGSDSRRHARP